MNIWAFQLKLTNRLIAWGSASILLGLFLFLLPKRILKGLGIQFIGWGFVDLVIALLGKRSTISKAKSKHHHSPKIIQDETERFKRILLFNSIADIFYGILGLLVIFKKGNSDPLWIGQGIGIIIQGAFLFMFDFFHALQIRATSRNIYADFDEFSKQV